MKIGIMLRHYGQPGGIGIYTANIVQALLNVDTHNHYTLIYGDAKWMGMYQHSANATEIVLHAPNKLLWDQMGVPRLVRKYGLDVIFNPKLSIPLFAGCKTVLISHGSAHFVVPQAYPWYDRAYFTIANQLYFRRASAVITVTHMGGEEIKRILHIPAQKVHPIHESYNERCRVLPRESPSEMREKYHLPDLYILWVGGVSPLKNIANLLRAFASVCRDIPHKLVMAGFTRWKFSSDMELIDSLGIRDRIHFTGYVQPDDIPALYNLASAFVFPSIYEGFGLPILEAMACGCPVITSTTGYAPEVAGDAAMLVNPYQPDEIGGAIRQVLDDMPLRERLIDRGLQRVKEFSWRKTAQETVALFESLEAHTQAHCHNVAQGQSAT